MKHSVPQPSFGSIETIENIVNVQRYASQKDDLHTAGYLQAVNEIVICLAPLLVHSKDPEIVAIGKKLGLIGVNASFWIPPKPA